MLNILRRYIGQSCIWDGPWSSPAVSDIIFPSGYGVSPYFHGSSDWANGTTSIGQPFNLTISDDCLSLSGQFAGKNVQFQRVIGPECSPGEGERKLKIDKKTNKERSKKEQKRKKEQ